MNKSFILLDKNNNIQKTANIIVKFSFEERDYLVYSIDENEQNCQIFVSKIILNSEGKYFIDNILPEEKLKLNNIVYNIVILIPTEAKKGNSFDVLSKNLFDKFAVKLSYNMPEMDNQEYYKNCSVAITNKLLAESAAKFYSENLENEIDNTTILPTWTAPIEVTAPTPIENNNVSIVENIISDSNINNAEPVIPTTLNLQSEPNIAPTKEENQFETNSSISNENQPASTFLPEEKDLPNPQAKKIAIISDPSLGFGMNQANVMDNKKAGFASSKHLIIGTVSLVLAVVVVIVAYVLISNMK